MFFQSNLSDEMPAIWRVAARAVAVVAAGCTVVACGGSGGGTIGSTDETINPAVPVLAADQADTLIRSSMLDHYTRNVSSQNGVLAVDSVALAENSGADVASTSPSTAVRFSDTNVQEAGVDESDRIKIDGSTLFALETPDSRYFGVFPVILNDELESSSLPIVPNTPPEETLSAYRMDKNNSAVLSRLKLTGEGRTTEGMYLHRNGGSRDLVLLSRSSFNSWEYWRSASQWAGLQTRISWVDASDAGNMSITRSVDIDGQLISSRKIDNRLVLVTRYHPQIRDIITYPVSEDDIQRNRELIERADDAEFLPTYTVDDGSAASIIADNRCYKSGPSVAETSQSDESQLTPYYRYPSVISIVTIDLNTRNVQTNNACFVGDTETIYVSQNALYLATTEYSYSVTTDSRGEPLIRYSQPEITTEVHKFSFSNNGAPLFKGTGSVSGHLGWNPKRKPFRMSEKDGNLRIVSFDESRSGSPVTLSVLGESGTSRLSTVSTLPNDRRPDPIGKPGESLYASRFIGDRAYLVTFRLTDPLYVLDLSNPRDPSIAGELELPGYSDYLHAVNDSLLLGLGKDAIADDGSSWGDGRGAWYQGVKLALFDVSDASNPFVAQSIVVGKRGTHSPALANHHAFAWLPSNGTRNARMAIPLSLHDENVESSSPTAWSDWTSNMLYTLEIDADASAFVESPNWTYESRAAGHRYSPVNLENDRAVIASDGGLYAIHNGGLQYGEWGVDAPVSVNE
ncbi:hypothetical protein AB833_25555 [Chromatiales bacterium (ex Bugula neritina AB1)]|nr:hypothetical protein AB833_25555 [Chromatiales bacterium (ex Bugula neritina AB1)]